MNVHEGKLLGCSYNQNCVGVWVVDLSVLLSPYPIFNSFIPYSPQLIFGYIASALSRAILEMLLSQMDKQRKSLAQEEIQ